VNQERGRDDRREGKRMVEEFVVHEATQKLVNHFTDAETNQPLYSRF